MLNQTENVTIENEFEEKRGSVCCQTGLRSFRTDFCRYFYTPKIQKELTAWKGIRIEKLLVAHTIICNDFLKPKIYCRVHISLQAGGHSTTFKNISVQLLYHPSNINIITPCNGHHSVRFSNNTAAFSSLTYTCSMSHATQTCG